MRTFVLTFCCGAVPWLPVISELPGLLTIFSEITSTSIASSVGIGGVRGPFLCGGSGGCRILSSSHNFCVNCAWVIPRSSAFFLLYSFSDITSSVLSIQQSVPIGCTMHLNSSFDTNEVGSCSSISQLVLFQS